MEQTLDVNEIVEIKQLPEIYQQLDKVNELIVEKTKNIDETLKELSKLSDEEQEEKKQEIKKYRTYLNSMKSELENKRKEIKKAIQKPYDEFENIYKDKALNVLDEGINKLSSVIGDIEQKQLQKKYDELTLFFNEYATFYHIENLVSFADLPIKINLSTSLESLKKQIKEFCEKISNDMIAISSEEFRDEILFEYKDNGFDYTKAKLTVINKHEMLEKIKKEQEELKSKVSEEQMVIENVSTLCSAPIEIQEELEEDEEIIEASFTIRTTRNKILRLIDYLKEMEIDYE